MVIIRCELRKELCSNNGTNDNVDIDDDIKKLKSISQEMSLKECVSQACYHVKLHLPIN